LGCSAFEPVCRLDASCGFYMLSTIRVDYLC